jgi:hypothetical protein
MNRVIRATGAAAFAAALACTAAVAQDAAISGEVKKIDEPPERSRSSTAQPGVSAWTRV